MEVPCKYQPDIRTRMITSNHFIGFLLILALSSQISGEPVKKCEVCQKTIEKVLDSLKSDGKELNPENIEKKFVSYCKNTQISVENRLVSRQRSYSDNRPVTVEQLDNLRF